MENEIKELERMIKENYNIKDILDQSKKIDEMIIVKLRG